MIISLGRFIDFYLVFLLSIKKGLSIIKRISDIKARSIFFLLFGFYCKCILKMSE